jgi:hypothetical protein
VWGRANRGSDTPSVDAWDGPLPADRHGIEFYTDVSPSPGSPPQRARWLGPRQGVSISGWMAKIRRLSGGAMSSTACDVAAEVDDMS